MISSWISVVPPKMNRRLYTAVTHSADAGLLAPPQAVRRRRAADGG